MGFKPFFGPCCRYETDCFSDALGAAALGFRWVLRVAVETVFAILLLFLLAAFLAFFSLFASVTHGFSVAILLSSN